MWNHAPLLSPLFLLFLTGPLFFALVVSYRDIENEIARKRKENGKGKTNPREYGSHRWFRMNLSERHPRLSFDSREIWLGVVLYRAVEIEKRSTLEPGYFHGRDGHNIGATEISCGSRPLPISTTAIIESGVYRRKSSTPSFRLYHLSTYLISLSNLLSIYCPRFRSHCERELNRNGQYSYIYSIYLSIYTSLLQIFSMYNRFNNFHRLSWINHINPNLELLPSTINRNENIKFR